jgi:hypothetical protein
MRICRLLEGSQDVTNLGWSVGVLIGRGFAPACSTHVVPRPCRCKHGAPVKARVQHFAAEAVVDKNSAFICFCLVFSAFSPGIKSRSAVLRRNRLVQIQIRRRGIDRQQVAIFPSGRSSSTGFRGSLVTANLISSSCAPLVLSVKRRPTDGSCGSVAAISTAPAPPYDAHFFAVPRCRAMMRDNQAKVQYSPVSGEQREFGSGDRQNVYLQSSTNAETFCHQLCRHQLCPRDSATLAYFIGLNQDAVRDYQPRLASQSFHQR